MDTILLICVLIASQKSQAFEFQYPATDEDTLLLEEEYKNKDDPLKEILNNNADENTDLNIVKILLNDIQNRKVDTELGEVVLTNTDEDFPELQTTRQVLTHSRYKDALVNKRSLFESIENIDQYIDNTNLYLEIAKEFANGNHYYQEGFISGLIKQAAYFLKQQIAAIKKELLGFDGRDMIKASAKLQRSILCFAKMVDILNRVQTKPILDYLKSKGLKGQKPVTSLNEKLSFPLPDVRGLAFAWSYYDDTLALY